MLNTPLVWTRLSVSGWPVSVHWTRVPSATHPDRSYRVTAVSRVPLSCTCPGYANTKVNPPICRHMTHAFTDPPA